MHFARAATLAFAAGVSASVLPRQVHYEWAVSDWKANYTVGNVPQYSFQILGPAGAEGDNTVPPEFFGHCYGLGEGIFSRCTLQYDPQNRRPENVWAMSQIACNPANPSMALLNVTVRWTVAPRPDCEAQTWTKNGSISTSFTAQGDAKIFAIQTEPGTSS